LDDDCNGEVDELGTVTCGIGACQRTVSACTAGAVSACVPGVPAVGPDGCDGVDNDCDGAVDEDCSACVHVAPNGDDVAAAASNGTTPFLDVQPALDFAATHPNVATRVCVAAGAACGATATYLGPTGADLTLHDGIDLLGNYESTTWTRCDTSITTLAPQTGRGVVFPSSIASRTVLDGFSVRRFSATTTVGVTVDGGQGALLSNLSVQGGPTVDTSYGVNVIDGGEATVFHSTIDAGNATNEMIAVRANGGTVVLEDNCATAPDGTTGRCTAPCSASGPGISATSNPPLMTSYAQRVNAVVLENAPGSRIERSNVCTHENTLGSQGADLTTIHVHGDATDLVVRGNSIQAAMYFQSPPVTSTVKAALVLEDCGGAEPRIVDNERLEDAPLSLQGDSYEGVHVAGDCHPIFDSNHSLGVNAQSWAYDPIATGVRCIAENGVASRCVFAHNDLNVYFGTGTTPGSTTTSVYGYGLSCEGGSCTRIEQNSITGASTAFASSSSAHQIAATGVSVDTAPAFIAGNQIFGLGGDGHCSASGVGLTAGGAARIENNVIVGIGNNTCSNGFQYGTGLSVTHADVDSNYIAVSPTACFGSRSGPPTAATGGTGSRFRNDILVAGPCGRAFVGGTNGPVAFEHNALSPILYIDDGNPITTAAAVDALTDTVADGTLAATCAMTSDYHLVAGSACVDAGTTTGAPPRDRDGDLRDAHPDIGPDEYVP
jgi:hypothetical protein